MRKVSAVLPTRNNVEELRECIASLRAQTVALQQILVCVDGSTDGTLGYLESTATNHAAVVALTHPGNAHRGRAATRNLALGAVGADDHVWYVDSDMVLAPDALARHLELADGRDVVSVGAVDYLNADVMPWAGYLDTRGRHRRAHGEALSFMQFTTANALVRANHVLALGGFDERFDGYGGEDLEFAYRLEKLSAAPFVNNKRAIASTIEEKTTEQALAQFETYGATNIHLLESLHPDMPLTFELQRMSSSRPRDRAFVAAMNPISDIVADALVRHGPEPVRNLALNYKVIRAIWRGYRAGIATP